MSIVTSTATESALTADDILKRFRDSGALLRGHFKLTSGRHSDVYYEKFAILKDPQVCEPVCRTLAGMFAASGAKYVVGPTTGGVIIAYSVANANGLTALYAEPAGPADSPTTGRVFKRGFSLEKGDRVLIVDDVLTTGRSLDEVIALVRSYGAEIVGIGVFLDRSGGAMAKGRPQDGVPPVRALASVSAESWEPDACPLCAKGEPITQRGSRKG